MDIIFSLGIYGSGLSRVDSACDGCRVVRTLLYANSSFCVNFPGRRDRQSTGYNCTGVVNVKTYVDSISESVSVRNIGSDCPNNGSSSLALSLVPCSCYSCKGDLVFRKKWNSHEVWRLKRGELPANSVLDFDTASTPPSCIIHRTFCTSGNCHSPFTKSVRTPSSSSAVNSGLGHVAPNATSTRRCEPAVRLVSTPPLVPEDERMVDESAFSFMSERGGMEEKHDHDLRVQEAEALGLEHLLAVLARELFEEIGTDDWEEPDDDESSDDESSNEEFDRPVTDFEIASNGGSHYSPLPMAPSPTLSGQPLDFLHDFDPRHENTPGPYHFTSHFERVMPSSVVFALALQSFGIPVDPPMYRTLPAVLHNLDVEPSFRILLVCPKCQEVYAVNTPADAKCTACNHTLYNTTPTAAEERHGHTSREKPKPLLQFPMKSLEEQLATLLMVPGIEDEISNSLVKVRQHVPGVYTGIFDGKICQELKAVNGYRFFRPSAETIAAGELRVGVTLGVDWYSLALHLEAFNNRRSQALIPSESTSATSHIMSNVLHYDQLAGAFTFPEGRLVRVALVALVCDKPAAHKLAGFGSHSHTNFYTLCWVKQSDKATPQGWYSINIDSLSAFRARTNAEQRRLQQEYLKCKIKSARDEFATAYATRWTELFHLPYFDVCEMVVIDPTHNLFLGLIKTHFYHIWVQQNVLRKTKELRALHVIMAENQQIPHIWSDYGGHQETPAGMATRRAASIAEVLEAKKQAAIQAKKQAAEEARRPQPTRIPTARVAQRDIEPEDDNGVNDGSRMQGDDPDYDALSRARKRPKPNTLSVAEEEERDNAMASNLHRDDPANFVKLCRVLRILVSKTITTDDLKLSDRLLRSYTKELMVLYGAAVIKPNHHYATHVSSCIKNYRPLREFWTFLFERLNKVLKSFKTGNQSGGELETTFFREFHRTVQQSRLLAQSAQQPPGSELRLAAEAMFAASSDDRGTVQSLAKELDEARQDDGIRLEPSTRAEERYLPSEIYLPLLTHLQMQSSCQRLVFIFVSQPACCSTSAENSLVAVRMNDNPGSALEIGELLSVLVINQAEFWGRRLFGYMRWKPSNVDITGTFWSVFKDVGVQIFQNGHLESHLLNECGRWGSTHELDLYPIVLNETLQKLIHSFGSQEPVMQGLRPECPALSDMPSRRDENAHTKLSLEYKAKLLAEPELVEMDKERKKGYIFCSQPLLTR
ncbi:uncharacterized protein EV420DRAFT_1486184 [Desarmillaria tabescens]|uniref:Uncharacterized protein n=1 Tax=Armillaria tabescens TaxID=1929756 RepID=A0AA39JBJ3_ARMTA|nr:uncharacterized protein EV420DRAFT_1486184 [Desarmillaria tabescens]KAK0439731.1 hypothetical protein EV420DRAFT_1486184 [Desarmillaria tabescens]